MKRVGQVLDPVYANTLIAKVKELTGISDALPFSTRTRLDFDTLKNLDQADYFVCPTLKGTRCLLFLLVSASGPETVCLSTLSSDIVPLSFPNNTRGFHHHTLIDGVLSETASGLQFIATDLIVIEGTSVSQRSFSTRLGILQQDVIQPFLSSQKEPLPFTVSLQKQDRAYALRFLYNPATLDNVEGLLFTPVRAPYKNGGLEWRPPKFNTIVFKLGLYHDRNNKQHYQLFLSVQKEFKYVEDLNLNADLFNQWRQKGVDGTKVECTFDPVLSTLVWDRGSATVKKGAWVFCRFTESPVDTLSHLQESMKSFEDPVAFSDLEARLDTMRTKWKIREKASLAVPLNKQSSVDSVQSISDGKPVVASILVQTPMSTHPLIQSPTSSHPLTQSPISARLSIQSPTSTHPSIQSPTSTRRSIDDPQASPLKKQALHFDDDDEEEIIETGTAPASRLTSPSKPVYKLKPNAKPVSFSVNPLGPKRLGKEVSGGELACSTTNPAIVIRKTPKPTNKEKGDESALSDFDDSRDEIVTQQKHPPKRKWMDVILNKDV